MFHPFLDRLTHAFGDLFEPHGGNMVNMPIYEVYQSMQTGLIDSTVTYGYFTSATKLDELITSITPIELSSSIVLATVMNKDVFDSLSADDQAAVKAAGASMHDYYGEHLGQAEAEAIETMTSGENGVVLKSFNDADHATLSASARPS